MIAYHMCEALLNISSFQWLICPEKSSSAKMLFLWFWGAAVQLNSDSRLPPTKMSPSGLMPVSMVFGQQPYKGKQRPTTLYRSEGAFQLAGILGFGILCRWMHKRTSVQSHFSSGCLSVDMEAPHSGWRERDYRSTASSVYPSEPAKDPVITDPNLEGSSRFWTSDVWCLCILRWCLKSSRSNPYTSIKISLEQLVCSGLSGDTYCTLLYIYCTISYIKYITKHKQ